MANVRLWFSFPWTYFSRWIDTIATQANTGLEDTEPADPEPQVVTAVPTGVAGNNGVPMHQQEKQGGKCCGCCCDYRRAVIVLACISIVLGILGLASNPNQQNNNNINDDELEQEIEDIADSYRTSSIIVTAIGLAMALLALGGGITFNWMMVRSSQASTKQQTPPKKCSNSRLSIFTRVSYSINPFYSGLEIFLFISCRLECLLCTRSSHLLLLLLWVCNNLTKLWIN